MIPADNLKKQLETTLRKIKWRYISPSGRVWLQRFLNENDELHPIKTITHRSIYRHSSKVFSKHYTYKGLRSLYKSFSGGNANNEGRLTLEIQKKGIPVPEVLAFGSIASGGLIREDIFVSKEVPDACTLAKFFHDEFQEMDSSEKKEWIEKFARFTANLTEHGIYHTDFYFNNVLVGGNEKDFFILDLKEVRLFSKPVSRRKRAKQLGILHAKYFTAFSRNDCFRFLNAYMPGAQKKEKRKFVAQIDKELCKYVHTHSQSRSRQSISTNSRFSKETADGLTVYRKRQSQLNRGISTIFQKQLPALKSSGKCQKDKPFRIGNTLYRIDKVVKLSLPDRLRLFAGSKEKRVWKNIWRIPFQQIPIQGPEMMVVLKKNSFMHPAYIVSEYHPKATLFREYCNQTDKNQRIQLLAKLGKLLGNMHHFGVIHNDLKSSNIVITEDGNICLKGFMHIKKHKSASIKKARKDLCVFLEEIESYRLDNEEKSVFINTWKKWAGFDDPAFGTFPKAAV
ncbi:MAG: lipopolysaccharide kinase InaA family protein [Desulfobacterales bacterium]